KFALAQKYTYCHERKDFKYIYPGRRTKDLVDLDKNLHEMICKKLISIFHNNEYDVMRWEMSTNFQSVTEKYNEGVIHTDKNTIFAAVIYLTPNASLNTGTTLWRKNKTFNQARYELAQAENDRKFRAGDIVMDTGYHKMFDEIVRVNNVYNTLILYEGRHFHSANRFFGETLKNSRLAQVFFINKIDAQKHSVFPIRRVEAIKV
ncbi:MAG: hypothetical protein COB34_08100, partial [Methylophilaceae bacterium]